MFCWLPVRNVSASFIAVAIRAGFWESTAAAMSSVIFVNSPLAAPRAIAASTVPVGQFVGLGAGLALPSIVEPGLPVADPSGLQATARPRTVTAARIAGAARRRRRRAAV